MHQVAKVQTTLTACLFSHVATKEDVRPRPRQWLDGAYGGWTVEETENGRLYSSMVFRRGGSCMAEDGSTVTRSAEIMFACDPRAGLTPSIMSVGGGRRCVTRVQMHLPQMCSYTYAELMTVLPDGVDASPLPTPSGTPSVRPPADPAADSGLTSTDGGVFTGNIGSLNVTGDGDGFSGAGGYGGGSVSAQVVSALGLSPVTASAFGAAMPLAGALLLLLACFVGYRRSRSGGGSSGAFSELEKDVAFAMKEGARALRLGGKKGSNGRGRVTRRGKSVTGGPLDYDEEEVDVDEELDASDGQGEDSADMSSGDGNSDGKDPEDAKVRALARSLAFASGKAVPAGRAAAAGSAKRAPVKAAQGEATSPESQLPRAVNPLRAAAIAGSGAATKAGSAARVRGDGATSDAAAGLRGEAGTIDLLNPAAIALSAEAVAAQQQAQSQSQEGNARTGLRRGSSDDDASSDAGTVDFVNVSIVKNALAAAARAGSAPVAGEARRLSAASREPGDGGERSATVFANPARRATATAAVPAPATVPSAPLNPLRAVMGSSQQPRAASSARAAGAGGSVAANPIAIALAAAAAARDSDSASLATHSTGHSSSVTVQHSSQHSTTNALRAATAAAAAAAGAADSAAAPLPGVAPRVVELGMAVRGNPLAAFGNLSSAGGPRRARAQAAAAAAKANPMRGAARAVGALTAPAHVPAPAVAPTPPAKKQVLLGEEDDMGEEGDAAQRASAARRVAAAGARGSGSSDEGGSSSDGEHDVKRARLGPQAIAARRAR